jgi:hypothetical protein
LIEWLGADAAEEIRSYEQHERLRTNGFVAGEGGQCYRTDESNQLLVETEKLLLDAVRGKFSRGNPAGSRDYGPGA